MLKVEPKRKIFKADVNLLPKNTYVFQSQAYLHKSYFTEFISVEVTFSSSLPRLSPAGYDLLLGEILTIRILFCRWLMQPGKTSIHFY